jgi:lipopolysaccharide transport system permease protein
MIRNLHELYQYRALLWNLTLRELKARYRASALGFLWTFLNPTLQMLVYALMFGVFLKQATPRYPFFLFTGLLPWICFSTTVIMGTSTISDRRDLLTKVRFPAQVLPATVVATNIANYVLSLPLMTGLGLFYGVVPTWHYAFFIPVLMVQTLFTLAVTYLCSAINVAFRDLQHIVNNLVTLAFFGTPVLYRVPAEHEGLVNLINPMAPVVSAYRAIFYEQTMPQLKPLAVVALLSVVLLWVSSWIFESRREEFAELV